MSLRLQLLIGGLLAVLMAWLGSYLMSIAIPYEEIIKHFN